MSHLSPCRWRVSFVLAMLFLCGCFSTGQMRTNLPISKIERISRLVIAPYAVEAESHYYDTLRDGWLLCRVRLRPDGVEKFLRQPRVQGSSETETAQDRVLFQGARLELLSGSTVHTARRFITATAMFEGHNVDILIDKDDPQRPDLYLYVLD